MAKCDVERVDDGALEVRGIEAVPLRRPARFVPQFEYEISYDRRPICLRPRACSQPRAFLLCFTKVVALDVIGVRAGLFYFRSV